MAIPLSDVSMDDLIGLTTDPTDTTPSNEALQAPQDTPVDPAPADPAAPAPVDTDAPADNSADVPPTDEEPSLYAELQTRLGFELEGEFGDDYDGMTQFVQRAADTLATQQQTALFNQFPDVQEYLQFRQNGGTPAAYRQTFAADTDIATVDLTGNVALQRDFVRAMYADKGLDEATVTDIIASYEDAGILEKQADVARKYRVNQQAATQQQLLADQETAAEQARQKAAKDVETIQATIKTGKVGTLTVPVAEQGTFQDWLFKPVDAQGNSQRMLDRQSLTQDQQLMVEYLLFKGLDLGKLAANVAKTTTATSLSGKLKGAAPAPTRINSGGNGTPRSVNLPSRDDLQF